MSGRTRPTSRSPRRDSRHLNSKSVKYHKERRRSRSRSRSQDRDKKRTTLDEKSHAKSSFPQGRSHSKKEDANSKRLRLGSDSDDDREAASGKRMKLLSSHQEKLRKQEEDDLYAELDAEAEEYHREYRKVWTLSDEDDEEGVDDSAPFTLEEPEEEPDDDIDPLDAFMVGIADEVKSLTPANGMQQNTISATEIMALTTKKKLSLRSTRATKPSAALPVKVKTEMNGAASSTVVTELPAPANTAKPHVPVKLEVNIKLENGIKSEILPNGSPEAIIKVEPNSDASAGDVNPSLPALPSGIATENTSNLGSDDDEEERFCKELLQHVRALEPRAVDLDSKPQESLAQDAPAANNRGELYFEGDDWEWGPEDEDLTYTVPRELKPVDHAKLFAEGAYIDFRKKFFIVPKELQDLSQDDLKALRKEMDGTKVTDPLNECPPPIKKWEHCGLPDAVLEVLKKLEFQCPFAIQSQAIPAIMSGRDVIGCASTGSGKTASYLLPALRHILDQEDIKMPIGPIALVLVPTRELATQVANEAKKFAKPLGLRVCCCYGGAPIAEQIADLKRMPHIIAATPGRMIDMLLANKGRVTCLTRVTYLVFDEADRMFDMGFGPQVAKVCDNTRPDRQTIMISATFPKSVEAAAKQWLKSPIEIVVGGRSSACSDVAQFVELFDSEEEKFLRLLQLLGEWVEKGLILVFVDTQAECDELYQDLYSAGYGQQLCMMHGGMDQYDREYTMYDFKKHSKTVMVATSVVARGLDIRALELVINYKCPNHYEDYIHRVGRTGRAGKKGTAYTFVLRDVDDHMANDLVRALKSAKCAVPEELEAKAAAYWDKAKMGLTVFKKRSGFGGKGYRFSSAEGRKKKEEIRKQMKAMGLMDELSDSSDDGVEDEHDIGSKAATRVAKERAAAPVETDTVLKIMHNPKTMKTAMAIQQAQAFAVQLAVHDALVKEQENEGHFTAEVEINNYHEQARREVTMRSTVDTLSEQYNVTITTKGVWSKTGRAPAGERLLYLFVEGSNAQEVLECKKEIQRRLDDKVKELLMRGGEKSAFANRRVIGAPQGRR